MRREHAAGEDLALELDAGGLSPDELREIVERAGGRRRLASAVGIHEGTLQNYVRGRAIPSSLAERLRALSAAQLESMSLGTRRPPEPLPDCELFQVAHAFLEEGRATGALRERTADGYGYCLGTLIRGGLRTVEDLTRERVGAFLEERRKLGIDPATLNRNLAAVCSLVSALERKGRVPLERLWGIRRLRFRVPPRGTPFFLTREQAAAVERASIAYDFQLGVSVVLALASGARAGELVGIRLEELHLEEAHPYLVIARDEERRLKTPRSARTVPLRRADAAKLLALGLGRGEGPIFPAEKLNSAASYLNVNTLGRRLATVRAAVGPLGGKLDYLTLRHTFISWHVQAGVSLDKVAGWAGNSPAVAWRHYSALAPGGDPDAERSAAP